MTSDEIIRDLPRALINWYNFEADSKVLFITGGKPECEVFFNALEEKGLEVVKTDLSGLHTICDIFDYIVAAGIIERSGAPTKMLAELKDLLKVSGKLLLGAENRLGIRYFCGDKDPFTGHVFDGIDGYANVSERRRKINGGRAYAKAEYKKMLSAAGFQKCRFFTVMPDITRPQMLLAEGYIPNEIVDMRVWPQYNSPETIFLEEKSLYGILMENHMFHQMANAFFIECTVEGEISDIDQVTVQSERARDGALATLVKYPEWAAKKALYPEGRRKICALLENAEYLRQHSVPVAEGKIEGDEYRMPYIKGQIATEYFRETLRSSRTEFIKELEQFRQLILYSSEHVPYEEVNWREFEPRWEKRKKDDPNLDQWRERAFGTEEERENIGVILKRGFVDMVCLNCFHTDEGFVFFDQEFYYENFPLNTILIRTIDLIYGGTSDLEGICPREDVLKHFKLYVHQRTWREKSDVFIEKLRNEKELAEYNKLHKEDYRTMVSNRHRMDYSQEEYERLFTNIFKGVGNKKIYLFGSGRYAEQFIEQFGQYYDIEGMIDNDVERQRNKLLGIEIYEPAVLKEIKTPFKVFICIKFFEDVLSQLKEMGIRDIAVYDPRLDYERPLKQTQNPKGVVPKKYHIGYVAGVFDLFHIGHLNLIRRAKEQCDHLIVGVVTDEQVIRGKKTRPNIPFQERLAIVRACRYVDEAVEIPADRPDTEDAFYMYHFDAQFSGSDYENDPIWLAKKAFLQQHGSDMIFFPYTKGISSTELKERVGGIGRKGEN